MNNEFKAKQFKDTTVYTLESATSGGTSAGAVASNSVAMGGVQQRRSKDSIIVQDYEKKIEPTKPRNFVAKNAKMGGAGQHKDKKKAEKQGDVKHKNKQVSIDEDHSTIGMNGKPFGFHSYATAGKNTSRWSGQGQDDSVHETPIEMDPSDPMNPMIYGHGVNPATLKYRMMRATGQLKDLAQRAQTASAVEWEMIAKQFDELTMNIEQIRHGIDELAKKRKKGGIGSRGIDAHIGEEVDEGWKSALGGAALAGAMALGGGARAQSSGEDFLPDIVAHVTFKVNGNTVTKDINLGTSFKSPGDASAALEKFLKSKGIKFYEFSLERVSEKEYNNNYLDKAPASDTGASGSMDSGPYSSTVSSSSDYMAKEGVAEGYDDWAAKIDARKAARDAADRNADKTGWTANDHAGATPPSKTMAKLMRIPGFAKTSPAEQQRVAKAVDRYLARDMSFDQALVLAQKQGVAEEWSQKYKSSINCSHPKGFSQKAHCAGKKKHTESMMTIEATCPDCGMCQTHGSLDEIKKGAKDSNGFTKCWPGHHAAGTKKGKNGGQVRNCVPNEGVAEGLLNYTRRQQLIQYLAKKLGWEVNYLELASDPELIKWYKAAQAGKDPMKAEHVDPYIESLYTQLSEKIPANAPVSAYIDDFMKAAKTPNAKGHHQFKNKSAEKIQQMAVAASYSAKNPSKKKK